jgi:hypothetical protein
MVEANSNRLPTIEEVVRHVQGLSEEQVRHLTSSLVDRENIMADMFRMAGMQFGLYPQIVAEVFAEVGIGTPVTEHERRFIREQFNLLMAELQRQQGGGS